MSDQGRLFGDDFETRRPESEDEPAVWRWAGRDGGRVHLVESCVDDEGDECFYHQNGRYITPCDRGPWDTSMLIYPPVRGALVCSPCWAWYTVAMLGDVSIEVDR